MNKDAETPLVSVIIPVYNRGHLLPRTIESVVNQTYRNLEIIVVDDGSIEDIQSIAESFNDKRIRYIRHAENNGVSAARNTGIEASSGKFIEFLDSDDEYLPEKTEKQVAIFKMQNVEMVYCGAWIYRPATLTEKMYLLYQPKFCRWSFYIHQLLVKKEVVDKAGFFDEKFHFVEDTDYLYRLKTVSKISGTPEPLVIYHDNPGSHSKDLAKIAQYTELFLEKYSQTLPSREKSQWYFIAGKHYVSAGKFVDGYREFFSAFLCYPWNRKALRKLIRLSPIFLVHFIKIALQNKINLKDKGKI